MHACIYIYIYICLWLVKSRFLSNLEFFLGILWVFWTFSGEQTLRFKLCTPQGVACIPPRTAMMGVVGVHTSSVKMRELATLYRTLGY